MKFLRTLLDKQAKLLRPGGKLGRLYPMHEALDTFLFTPEETTATASHVRDALDLKRMMSMVIVALVPCIFMAMYNTGLQANLAIQAGAAPIEDWRAAVLRALSIGYDPANLLACLMHGALVFLPVLLVTYAVGGTCEALFALVRKHEINEGFLVTGMLFPLIMPPGVSLLVVALGVAFGVVVGKEVFGGTGRNVLNPALTGRAFLFFAYPQYFTGNYVWARDTDAYTGATWLARTAEEGRLALSGHLDWMDAFLGFIPGTMGETSTLACLLGAFILIATGIGSWRIMLGVALGSLGTILLFNRLAPFVDNPMFGLPFHWHIVLGGWAFGTAFMATDPVSAAYTNAGRWIYGLCIGVLVILIRVVNPAFPEGIMLAILFMNVFAALIDHLVIRANVKRRMARYAA